MIVGQIRDGQIRELRSGTAAHLDNMQEVLNFLEENGADPYEVDKDPSYPINKWYQSVRRIVNRLEANRDLSMYDELKLCVDNSNQYLELNGLAQLIKLLNNITKSQSSDKNKLNLMQEILIFIENHARSDAMTTDPVYRRNRDYLYDAVRGKIRALENTQNNAVIDKVVKKLIGVSDEHVEHRNKRQRISISDPINHGSRQNNLFNGLVQAVGSDKYKSFLQTSWAKTIIENEIKDWYSRSKNNRDATTIIKQILKAYYFPSDELEIGVLYPSRRVAKAAKLPETALAKALPFTKVEKLIINHSILIPMDAEPEWHSINSLQMGNYFGFNLDSGLYGEYEIPKTFFKNMRQLKSLRLIFEGEFKANNLPDLSYLSELEHLYIEIGRDSEVLNHIGRNALFPGEELLKNLPNLNELTIDGFTIFNLTSDIFNKLPNIHKLKTLSLLGTTMQRIEANVFSELRLQSLTITGNLSSTLFNDPMVFNGLNTLTDLTIESYKWEDEDEDGANPLPGAGANPLPGVGADPLLGAGANPLPGAGANPLPGAGADPLPEGDHQLFQVFLPVVEESSSDGDEESLSDSVEESSSDSVEESLSDSVEESLSDGDEEYLSDGEPVAVAHNSMNNLRAFIRANPQLTINPLLESTINAFIRANPQLTINPLLE